ncbi:transporter substrate-binding domain-containing protein [Pseudoalteromonas sp. SR45-6]|uniref:substrate-binding periplasmic protein n=1 Tax=Pseudoalteromonas sp. SR45-6 TaxID=2760927 RepID=UPI001600D8A9|nr:transporter substrate-binding domain-containing protein [Pseudoalteromonas sp. SR45-6]MBB1343168.1 transporter substrate-binding domain-containing protein [Pseudoalteromonas sp. SR45-6]
MRFIFYIFIIFAFINYAYAANEPNAAVQKISLAVDHAPPYSQINQNGEVSGAIVDIFREMKKQLPFKLELVGCPFSRCVRMLEQGEVNAMGGLILTPMRQQVMQFVTPPYMVLTSSFVFYAREDSQLQINNYDDLYGKKIAIMRGAVHFKRFDEDDELTKIAVLTESTAINLLLKGRADLVIAVEDTADHAMSVLNQPANKLVKMRYRFNDIIYGYLALSKQFSVTPLAQRVDALMKTMAATGQLNTLIAPYELPPLNEQALSF